MLIKNNIFEIDNLQYYPNPVKLLFKMMNNNTIIELLKNFDVNPKEGEIYLALLQKGILSPLQLSRSTLLNRTTIYRILEKLKKIGLVEEVLDEKRTKAKAISPNKFEMIIKQKESEVDKLKQTLPSLKSQLTTIQGVASPETKVLYYRGQNGLRQLLWNTLQAQDEIIGYGYMNWNEVVGKEYAEKLRSEVVTRKRYSREIQNKESIDPLKIYTKITGYEKFHTAKGISKETIEIKHDTYIYNNVFAFSHFIEEEFFGIEIYNAEIVKTQRQIFEILWEIATPKLATVHRQTQ